MDGVYNDDVDVNNDSGLKHAERQNENVEKKKEKGKHEYKNCNI